MENSSKALLIAGTVLIAILLISVGVKTINSTSGMTDQVDLNSQTIAASTFNAQFLPYLSNKTSGAKAKDLVSKVLKHNITVNSSDTFSAESHQIYINLYDSDNNHITTKRGHNWTISDLQEVYNLIYDNLNYKIYVTPACSYPGGFYNGYVICLSIKPAS